LRKRCLETLSVPAGIVAI